jgi:hypothetical protein
MAPLLALASMLQPDRGRLFVGGDHRQLPCIQVIFALSRNKQRSQLQSANRFQAVQHESLIKCKPRL